MPTTPDNNVSFKKILDLHMLSPETTLFEGEVEAITTLNDKGVFDVLPLHENFISIVKRRTIVHYKIGKEKKEFEITVGVIKVKDNKVHVLTGFESLGSELGGDGAYTLTDLGEEKKLFGFITLPFSRKNKAAEAKK